jgi:predicted secreted protein
VPTPDGVETETAPATAEDGTVATIVVEVEESTLAALFAEKVTVFWLGVELNPVPVIVT